MTASDHLSTPQFGESSLDYHGHKPQRISVHDPAAGPSTHPYFKDHPGMVGFADFTPDIRYPGETYVHYVSTRPDQTGKGVATHIANHLVEHAKAAGHNVDWGLIDNPTMDSVRKKVEMAHPDVAFHHKQGFR